MARFRINILGCGSATPTPRHNPSAQVVDFRDTLYMIDCGEGAQKMMRTMSLKFSRLSHIFISHMHGDHVLGLPGLLSTLALHEKSGRVTVHLPASGLELMRSVTGYFCREAPYDIVFEPLPADGGVIIDTSALTISSFPLYHRIPAYGFLFAEKPKPRHLIGAMLEHYGVPVAARHALKYGADFVREDGTVVENSRLTTAADPSVSYAYCSDTMFDTRVAEAVKGVHTLYHEATYDDSLASQARERGHSTAREAGRIAAMAGASQLVIGHYSNRYDTTDLLAAQAREEFPSVIAAAEGMKLDLL